VSEWVSASLFDVILCESCRQAGVDLFATSPEASIHLENAIFSEEFGKGVDSATV
jgi:hypothetical protein